MKALKFLLRLFLSPVVLLISIFELAANFTLHMTSWIFSIISLVVLITSVFIFFNDGPKESIFAFVLAWLLSPFGIPLIAQIIIDTINTLKTGIKRIYS